MIIEHLEAIILNTEHAHAHSTNKCTIRRTTQPWMRPGDMKPW